MDCNTLHSWQLQTTTTTIHHTEASSRQSACQLRLASVSSPVAREQQAAVNEGRWALCAASQRCVVGGQDIRREGYGGLAR